MSRLQIDAVRERMSNLASCIGNTVGTPGIEAQRNEWVSEYFRLLDIITGR